MYDGYLKRCPVDNDDTSAPARWHSSRNALP
jgi:hypothetical protein